MRIGVDARYVYDHFPGIGRYIVHLVHALAEVAHEHRLVLLHNPALPNTRYDLQALHGLPNVELFTATARPFTWVEQVQIPHLARVLRLDVLHFPYYLRPYVGVPCPTVVTLYDLIGRRFPYMLSLRSRYVFNAATWLALAVSQGIITMSHSARADIAHYYRVPQERMVVTMGAADQRFCPQPAARIDAMRATYGLPSRYVLYVGANKPHKNLVRLVQAWGMCVQNKSKYVSAPSEKSVALFEGTQSPPIPPPHRGEMSDVRLVIAGHYDPHYPEVQHAVDAHGLADTVIFIPNVDEADLPALYSGAEVFVFPSLYEGFGLPIVEAMACGTPVVCSNVSSMPEVAGDAACMVDPYDSEALALALQQLLTTPSLQEDLRQRGLQQANTFSWQRTARETLAVYESLVG